MLGSPAFLAGDFSDSRLRKKIGVLWGPSFVSFSPPSSISLLPLKILLSSPRRIVLGGSFKISAFPIDCGGTGFLPDRRGFSTPPPQRSAPRSSPPGDHTALA